MSHIPIEMPKISDKMTDMEILRVGLIAELDAINLYEQLAATANDEKTHVGEFLEMLLRMDSEQIDELENGKKEVDEL